MIAKRAKVQWLQRFVLSAAFLVAVASARPAKADDWPDPAKWDGKYPYSGPRADFYRLTSIRAALLKLVGEQFYENIILESYLYNNIIATGDTIFVTGCMPHNCGAEQVTTVIQGRKISVCLYYAFRTQNLDSALWPAERLWFIEGVGLPAVEHDPDDVDQCTFESMDDLHTKLERARALAE